MTRFEAFGCLYLCLLVFTGSRRAQQATDFSGDWVMKVGKRTFLGVSVIPPRQGAASFGGTLVRLQHFSSAGGGGFSNIRGPLIHYPIVRNTVKENCLFFTVQNPADKSDEDSFQLCTTDKQHATLKPDFPGVEPWPVTKESKRLVVNTDWESARTYYLDDSDVSSSEMQRIFEADQNDRQSGVGKIDWRVVNKSDADRRQATAKLLRDGKLHTGEDFERAAFIFQHGDTPDDYLLAHSLAMVAVARGRSGALWIAAATLDRYLNSVHQAQIYGTQFWTKPSQPTTQEPYNRILIPDSLRRFLDVPSQAMQEEQRKQYDSERSRQ